MSISSKAGELATNDNVFSFEDMFDASAIEEQRKSSNTNVRRTIPLVFQQSEHPLWVPRLKLTKQGEAPVVVSTKEPFNVYQEVINKKGESKLALLPIVEYHGWIMLAEYGAGVSEWDGTNKVMHNHCNTLGSAPLGQSNTKVNAIFYPLRSMYQYDADAPYTKPSQDVLSLNPFGSRGEWCGDCIRNCHNQIPSVVEPDNKLLRCKAWGYMYMMVTSLTVKEGDDIVRYNVKELYNNKSEPLNYFPLAIDLKESSIQGAPKQGIIGAAQVHEDCKLEPYKFVLGTNIRDIPRLTNPVEIAKFKSVHSRPYSLRAVFKENAITGDKATWSQGHFVQDYETKSDLNFKEQIDARQDERDECLAIWKETSPLREIQELTNLPLGQFGNDVTSLKSADVAHFDPVVNDSDEGWGVDI
jgi:hypothetical protein